MYTGRTIVVFLCLVFVFPGQVPEAEGKALEASFRGYVEARYHGFFGLDPALEEFFQSIDPAFDTYGYHPDTPHGGILRARSTLNVDFLEHFRVTLAGQAHAFGGFYRRPQNQLEDVVSLERAYLTFSSDYLDLSVGKQALGWGSGLLLNPTDLFFEASFADPWQERPGLWSVRGVIATGEASNLILAAALEDECCNAVAISRFEMTVDTWDFAVQAAWRETGNLFVGGVDIKGDVEVGLWTEATVTVALEDGRWHFDAEVGIDYTFDLLRGLYVAVEWLHQGDGVSDDYVARLLTQGFERTSAFLGKDYGIGLLRLAITGEWQLSLMNLTNIQDSSGTLVSQVTWLASDWLELIVGGGVTYGDSESEYGLSLPAVASIPGPLQGSRLGPVGSVTGWARVYF